MAGITDFSFHSESSTIGTGSRSSPGWFDTKYYLAKNPDVARQLSDLPSYEKYAAARQHFDDYGAKELRNPNALFDMKAYRDAYPDVAASGVNPFLHYRTHGRMEGREAFPVQDGSRQSRSVQVPQVDAAPSGLAGIGQDMMEFQVEAASADERGLAGDRASMSGQEVWAHGSVLMQPEAAVAVIPALAPPQPDGAGVMMLAGLGAILPGVPAVPDVQLLETP